MFNSKLPNVGTTIFTVMSKMANDYNAINLSQGFPDFQCDEELMNLVHHYMLKGFNQYAPLPGVLPLRKKLIEKIDKLYKRKYDIDNEITITSGATHGNYTVLTSIIKPGDEVIVIQPAYDSYLPTILVNGGIPVCVNLERPDFTYNWDLINNAITSKTKIIIINSPNNPSGTLINENDVRELEKIIIKHDIFVLSDEVYEHITFDGNEHISLSSSKIISEKAFVVSSFGKTFHTTGWKMGHVVAPEPLMKEYRKIHMYNMFSINTAVQFAYADYLENEDKYLSLPKFYQNKRDLFINLIKNSKFKFKPADGTYFQLFDYSDISDMGDYAFSEWMTKEVGVAVIPLSPFYNEKINDKLIRICFAKTEEVLKAAAEKIVNI